MPADRLPFGQRFDPGGGERRGLDAKARIDHDQPLGQKLREMLGFAIGPRKANARGLRDVVDAQKDEIEPPRADAARFEIKAELIAQLAE